jgi:hypothetical protein
MATHGGVSYMVTELLEGETLREQLRRARQGGTLPDHAGCETMAE